MPIPFKSKELETKTQHIKSNLFANTKYERKKQTENQK